MYSKINDILKDRPSINDLYQDLIDALTDNPNSCLTGGGTCPDSHPAELDGAFLVKMLNYNPKNFVRNSWCLIAISIGFRILAYCILAFRFRAANR